MTRLGFFGKLAFVLLVIGGLNWGLVGLFNLDVVQSLLGSVPTAQKIVYILIGLSGLFLLLRAIFSFRQHN